MHVGVWPVVDFGQEIVDVSRHGECDFVVGIVPVCMDAAVKLGIPVNFDCVPLAKYGKEIIGFFFVEIFYRKVVDNQNKPHLGFVMGPISRGMAAWCVAVWLESFVK